MSYVSLFLTPASKFYVSYIESYIRIIIFYEMMTLCTSKLAIIANCVTVHSADNCTIHNWQMHVSFLNLGIQTTISLFVQIVQNLSAVKKSCS
jgi:hypothetical protein